MISDEERLGKLIGENIKETQELNQSMSHSSGEDTNIVFPTNTQEIIQIAARTRTRQIGTAFILGHGVNGILGTSQLGAGTRGSWVVNRVVCPNDTFKEWLAGTEFQDTTNTTATHDSSDEEVSFTNGQVYQTKIFYMNETNILSATPNIHVRSGSVKFNIDTSKPGQTINITCDD